jgi:hypothetical protein
MFVASSSDPVMAISHASIYTMDLDKNARHPSSPGKHVRPVIGRRPGKMKPLKDGQVHPNSKKDTVHICIRGDLSPDTADSSREPIREAEEHSGRVPRLVSGA